MTLQLVPIDFAAAAGFVTTWHRHHTAPTGHKFSIGVADDEVLVGVVMVGRPVARMYDDGQTLEVNRTATDGTHNANSMLYGAAWRATSALGYRRLITYTQEGESGSSLRAAGWRVIAQRPPTNGWSRPSRPANDKGVDHIALTRERRAVSGVPTDPSWRNLGWACQDRANPCASTLPSPRPRPARYPPDSPCRSRVTPPRGKRTRCSRAGRRSPTDVK